MSLQDIVKPLILHCVSNMLASFYEGFWTISLQGHFLLQRFLVQLCDAADADVDLADFIPGLVVDNAGLS